MNTDLAPILREVFAVVSARAEATTDGQIDSVECAKIVEMIDELIFAAATYADELLQDAHSGIRFGYKRHGQEALVCSVDKVENVIGKLSAEILIARELAGLLHQITRNIDAKEKGT